MSKNEVKQDENVNECLRIGDAKIFVDEIKRGKVDEMTYKQIKAMVQSSGISHARVMPDCQAATDCVVGFTAHLTDKVIPAWIGNDIGCGIIAYRLGVLDGGELSQKELKRFDVNIRKAVPMGTYGSFTVHPTAIVSNKDIDEMCQSAKFEAEQFVIQFKMKHIDLNFEVPPVPSYGIEWFRKKCKQVYINYHLALRALGSLGAGNHFIELDRSDTGVYWLTVHSGSRSFGSKICALHQGRLMKQKAFDRVSYEREERRLKKMHKKNATEYANELMKLKARLQEVEENPVNFLSGAMAFDYFYDLIFANQYAKLNRRLILKTILDFLKAEYDQTQIVESIHNTIDMRDFILRKGAIAAHKDEKCLVALNMRDGILLCKGKGEEDWNFSCAHGAGRIGSRASAMNELSMSGFRSEMSGIYSSSVVKECLDESPSAYKESRMIMNIISQTVDIVEQLRPVVNIK